MLKAYSPVPSFLCLNIQFSLRVLLEYNKLFKELYQIFTEKQHNYFFDPAIHAPAPWRYLGDEESTANFPVL